MGILIKGAKVVTSGATYQADVQIEGETIAAIGAKLESNSGDRVIDAAGRWLIPGGIDPHVHMALPFMGTVSRDDFDSGTAAAIAGGTTTIIDFAIPPKGASLLSSLKVWDEKARAKARCDYSYHMAVTDWNEGIAAEIPKIVDQYGINSFKIFLAYMGVLGVDDAAAFKILGAVRDAGGLVTVHAVNGHVLVALGEKFAAEGKLAPIYHALAQPPEAEGEATGRIIRFAEINQAGVYIVHISAEDAMNEVAAGRARGRVPVIGESCTQYFFLTQDLYELPNFEGAKYVLSPPLRPRSHCDAMWRGLSDNSIEVIGTDHCSFDFKGQKDMGRDDYRKIPNGLTGVEERMTMMYSYGVYEGRISAERWIATCATNAAKIFGIYPKKGVIAIGSDADVVLWDPATDGVISARTHKSRCDTNVFEGYKTKGRPSIVFVRGEVAFENGEVTAQPGNGRFLKRNRFNPNWAA